MNLLTVMTMKAAKGKQISKKMLTVKILKPSLSIRILKSIIFALPRNSLKNLKPEFPWIPIRE